MPLSYRGMATASKIVGSRRRRRWPALALTATLLLAACSRGTGPDDAASARLPAKDASAAPTVPAAEPAGVTYAIVADESLLTLRVYRAGALARLGHNHVIASRHLQGRLRLGASLADSSLSLTIPVTLLTIDEPELRALAGSDFEAAVPDSARSGTRDNLMSPALLEGGRFPGIEIESGSLSGSLPGRVMATLQIRVRDVQTRLELPVNVEQPDATTLVASGEATLRQSQFGLVPFSVMMGALQVQDEMQLQFRIVARR